MFVRKLKVLNFRSLQNVSIEFSPGLNVLVGKNNAGKSNIIRALDYILGEKWPTYQNFEGRDFYRSDRHAEPSDYFFIAVFLEDVHLSPPEVSETLRKVQVRYLPQSPNWNDVNYFLNEFSMDGDKDWWSYPELAQALTKARGAVIFLAVPREGERKERVYGMVFKHQGRWVGVPSFRREFRDALITTAFVPAFRDPENQLRITHYTWYGRLIRALYEDKTETQEERIRKAQEEYAQVLGEIFFDATETLRSKLKESIFSYSVSFVPGAYTKDDEYKQITLFIDDGLDGPFYEKGSGVQSALVIGLFSYYCERFHSGGSLLLVEEPELYLHPQARRAIESQLVEFVEEGKVIKGQTSIYSRQVIISTHTPEFVRSTPLSQVVLVRRPRGQIYTRVLKTHEDLPRAQQALQTKSIELLFADFVILVEGGEEFIIPPLADLLFERRNWLDRNNVSVVRVNGKSWFATYIKILDALEIPWIVLTDLDFLRDEVSKFKGYFDEGAWTKIDNIRTIMKSSIRIRGRDVKEALSPSTRNWVDLYHRVEQAIATLQESSSLLPEEIEGIVALWKSLRDRVQKPDYGMLSQSPYAESLSEVLKILRSRNFFVLSRGELEDYLTDKALQLEHGKDARALAVGAKLLNCVELREAKEWVRIDEFVELLHVVGSWVETVNNPTPRAADTASPWGNVGGLKAR